jgi:hypothetical protein
MGIFIFSIETIKNLIMCKLKKYFIKCPFAGYCHCCYAKQQLKNISPNLKNK